MATKQVKIKVATAGSTTGPFTIKDQALNVIGTATRTELLAGKTFTVDDSVTQFIVMSTDGVCNTTQSLLYVDGVPQPITYYRLYGCDSTTASATTRIAPYMANQRYVLPSSGGVLYYTWTGQQFTTATPPGDWNGSIQRTTLQGCP